MPTDSGPEVAECIWAPQWVSEDVGGLPVCAGIASEARPGPGRGEPPPAGRGRLAARQALIREHELPMKVTAGRLPRPRENVFMVYFSAPHRVDFRALVRDLAGR